METKISLTRQTFLIEDVDMLGFRITNMTLSGGDSSTLVSLEEMTNTISSLQQQININTNTIQTVDTTDGASIGAIPLSENGAVNGVTPLGSDGKVSTENLPLLSIRDVFIVNNEMDKLALIAQKGDIALVESTKQSYILAENLPSSNDSWVKFHTLADIYPIQQVQGKTGDVVLTAQDIGAVPSAHPKDHFYYNPEPSSVFSVDTISNDYVQVSSSGVLNLSSITTSTPKFHEFETSNIITRYTIAINTLTNYPVYWKLIGSNDNFVTEFVLDERTNPLGSWNINTKTFDVSTPKLFSKVRLSFYVAGSSGSTSTSLAITNVTYFSNVSSFDGNQDQSGFYKFRSSLLNPSNVTQTIPGVLINGTEHVYWNGNLIDSPDDYRIVSGSQIDISSVMDRPYQSSDISVIKSVSSQANTTTSILPELIPYFAGTSTTYDGVTISVSHQVTTGMAHKLVDQNSSSQSEYWDTGAIFTGGGFTGSAWIMFAYSSPKYLESYNLIPSSSSKYSPKSWVFEASNDASVWTTLGTVTLGTAIVAKTRYDLVPHSQMYTYYRIRFTSAFSAQLRLLEIELFNNLYGISTVPFATISANSNLWYQSNMGYSQYNVPAGLNNQGVAFGSGLRNGIIRWDNVTESRPNMYSLSQWANTTVYAPKSWRLFASDEGFVNHVPATTKYNTYVDFDTTQFTQTVSVVNDNITLSLEELNSPSFNLENYNSKLFDRTNNTTKLVYVESSEFTVGAGDIFFSCYVEFQSSPLNGEVFTFRTSSIRGLSVLVDSSQRFIARIGDGSTYITITDPESIEVGRKYHLTLYRKSGVVYFYVNGNLIGSSTNTYNFSGNGLALFSNYYNVQSTVSSNEIRIWGCYFSRTAPSTHPSTFRVNYGVGYFISSSSNYSTSYDAIKSFTGVETNYWASAAGNPLGWIGVEKTEPFVVRSYYIKTGGASIALSSYPKSWTLESSNDGLTWVQLDTQINNFFIHHSEEKFFMIENETPYMFYRIRVIENAGASYTTFRVKFSPSIWEEISKVENEMSWVINEVRYFSAYPSKPYRFYQLVIDDAEDIGSYMLIKNLQIYDKTENYALVLPPPKNKIVVVGQGNFVSAYNLFDSDSSNYWIGSYPDTTTYLPLYVNLDSSSVVNSVYIKSPNSSISWIEVFGSSDGVIYRSLSTFKQSSYNMSVTPNGCQVNLGANTESYSRYLFKIYSTTPTDIRISGIEMNNVSISNDVGIKLNIDNILPSDKIVMKYIGR